MLKYIAGAVVATAITVPTMLYLLSEHQHDAPAPKMSQAEIQEQMDAFAAAYVVTMEKLMVDIDRIASDSGDRTMAEAADAYGAPREAFASCMETFFELFIDSNKAFTECSPWLEVWKKAADYETDYHDMLTSGSAAGQILLNMGGRAG